jgi:hypothetical protein
MATPPPAPAPAPLPICHTFQGKLGAGECYTASSPCSVSCFDGTKVESSDYNLKAGYVVYCCN